MKINGNSSNITSLQSNTAQLATTLGIHNSNIGSLNQSIITIETDLGNVQAEVNTLQTDLTSNVSRISSLESSSVGGLFTNTITSQRANGQAVALYARDTNSPDRADNIEYNYVLNAPRPGTTQGGIDLFINSANRTDDGGASTTTLRNGNGKLRLGYTLYDTVLESNVAMADGKIVKYGANGTYLGSPTNSTHGGNGTRFVLWPGTANTAVPYGMGMESAHMWFSSPGGHRFYTGTTAKMTINGNGVGIGTSAPTEQLHVYENLSTSGHQICGRIGGHTSSYNTLVLGSKDGRPHIGGHRGDYGIWADLSLQNDLMVLKQSNMCVGIGNTNPAFPLTIGSSDGNKIQFNESSTPGHNITCSSGWQFNFNAGRASQDDDAKIAFHISGSSGYDEMMRVTHTGVGIGTTNPHCPLQVSGTGGAMGYGNKRFFKYDAGIASSSGGHSPLSIYANGSIVSGNFFVSHSGSLGASDQRIKKNIVDADDAECLETLRLLKPKKYEYKDVVKKGEEPVWGFIAQEVANVLPHATQLRQEFIPNIYELANVSSSNVITFTNFNTSNLESNATTLIRTKGIDGKDHDIHLAEVIDEHTIRVEEDLTEWTGSVDAEGNVISEITTTTITPEDYEALEDTSGYVANISGYQNANVSISVEEYNALEDTTGYEQVVQDYTKTSTTYPGNQLFVYGQQVDDFVFLKKESIFTVATSALQEVDRQQQADKVRIADLESRIEALEAQLASS